MSLLLAFAVQAAAQSIPMKMKASQPRLDAITDACRVPRDWLRHDGDDQVQFAPSSDAKYDKIHCVLKRLDASIAPLKLGFIGNEQLSEGK